MTGKQFREKSKPLSVLHFKKKILLLNKVEWHRLFSFKVIGMAQMKQV